MNEILARPELALLLDCGLGKTLISLSALDILIGSGETKKALVVAPKRVAEEAWPEEIEKWGFKRKYSLVAGSPAKRLKALNEEAVLYIVGRDNLAWLAKQGFTADMLIADELSSFKSLKSARFKALKALRPYAKRFVGLTGTPVSNGLIDLFPQMYLVDRGKALGRSIVAYRDKYFLPDFQKAGVVYSWKPRPGSERAIEKAVSVSAVSMRSAGLIGLPERLDVFHTAKLSKASMAAYKQMEKTSVLEWRGQKAVSLTAATLAGKLSQLGGGAVYGENGKAIRLFAEKLDLLDETLEALNGQNAIVCYSYQHELDRIKERHKEAIDVRQKGAVALWKSGKAPLMLMHPQSAGHGLNLQSGGCHIIWFNLPLGDLDLYEQTCKRLHRIGQDQTVVIHHLFSAGTKDEWLYRLLKGKSSLQEAFLKALAV